VTALLRCDHAYDAALGGWHCVVDKATGETSVPGVYAAGEVTGVAGMRPAVQAGEQAGRAAAQSLGLGTVLSRLMSRSAKRDMAFAEGIMRIYAPPPLRALLQQDETIACRCEEVSCGAIRASLAGGTGRVQGAKLWSRAGMGACQGRICGWAVAELAAEAQGQTVEAMGFNAPRIPLRPVPLSTVHETLSRADG
jgi:NADPH-dependent 2,4-dienoyl-CoA reductase/sulfur reductase-like enzyme